MRVRLKLEEPVLLDKSNHTSVLNLDGEGWIIDENTDGCKVYGTSIIVGLSGAITSYTVPGSTDYTLIATMTFKVEENWAGKFDLELIKEGDIEMWDVSGKHGYEQNYQFEGFEPNTPATVEINVLKGFNFATKPANDTFSIAEDEYPAASPFSISATDSDYFESSQWDLQLEQLVAVTPPQAKFTSIKIGEAEWTAGTISDYFGDLQIVNGKIEYAQAQDYFGEFTVEYEVASTSTATDGAKDSGSFKIVVTPVNDAPEISLLDYDAVEGDFLVFNISVTDVEGDSFVVNRVKLGVTEIEGLWAPVNGGAVSRNGTGLEPGEYHFVSSEILDYDWVVHQNKTADFELIVSITDTNDDPKSAVLSKEITVEDTDRPQSNPVVNGFSHTNPKTTDDIQALFNPGQDEDDDYIQDEDDDYITVVSAWYDGDTLVQEGDTLEAANTVKNKTYTFKVYTTTEPYEDFIVTSATDSASVTVLNSAPVAQDHKVFIRKMDGGEGIKVFDLFATDADNDDLAFTVEGAGPQQKGSLDIEGNKATYTVYDSSEEFFGNDADVFSILVDDGDGGTTTFQVSVTYRENPPASISTTTEPDVEYLEVDANGNATTITVAIRAEDSIEVLPAGIPENGIKWEVLRDGVALATAWEQEVTNSFDLIYDEESSEVRNAYQPGATSECTFTLGYDILQGADRPAEADFVIRVTVTDALGSEETEEWPIIVKDVDRQPDKPGQVVFDPDEIRVNETLTATASSTEEFDADGDAISYKYIWSADGKDPILGQELTGQKKGEKWTISAYSVTTPYGKTDEVLSAEATVKTIIVSNTAPTADELAIVTDEDCDSEPVKLAGNDDDEDDKLTYEITVLPEHGTVVLTDDKVVYTPDPDYNGLDSFTYSVSDGDESTEATVSITINPVNDPPVLDAIPNNIYIVPDDMGKDLTFTYTIGMGGGEDEIAQAIRNAYLEVRLGNEIFAVTPAVDWLEHDISISFTVDAQAALGSEAELELTVSDDGGGTSEQDSASKIIKVVLGATPWYPIYAIACDEHPIHQVTIKDGNRKVAELIVEGDTMKPADYYEAGVEGLPAAAVYEVELRAWSASAGVSKQPCDVDAPDLQVPSYTVPGKGELSYDLDAKQFKISTPLAASYTLSISYPNDSERVFKGVYTPNEDGLILPEVELPMEFFAAGEYSASVFGTNPKGDGELSELINFSIAADSTATLEWPVGGFVPADSASILVADGVS
ncbi:MAG: Ig-like domain-containing protein, partial [Lentisphaeria bacterium]|nr:Ig-like domain-containing protein [Lentisphaeria bacterium]